MRLEAIPDVENKAPAGLSAVAKTSYGQTSTFLPRSQHTEPKIDLERNPTVRLSVAHIVPVCLRRDGCLEGGTVRHMTMLPGGGSLARAR